MNKHLLTSLALLAMLSFATPSLFADKDKDKGHGNPHARAAEDHDGDHDGNGDHDGWERRGQFEYRTYSDHDGTPPGWSHGKKAGWGDCGMPPGQAKKYGCRTYTHEGRPYYFYRDDQGRTVVRRPIIEVHGSVDIVR